MYVAIVPNRGSKPIAMSRESFRGGGKVKNRTIATLSHLPERKIELIRMVLAREDLVPADDAFEVVSSLPTGHVRAVPGTIRRLGIAEMVSSRPCRERDPVMGMIAERVLHATSKFGTVRSWKATTLALEVGVKGADEDDLYEALDWLAKRQGRIEGKLAGRHLKRSVK